MARTYKRDSRGRFAGGGGSSSRGGGRKPLQRGTNRLTRDNAGRITSVGGDGATARGGRLRTASGKQRATVTAKGIGKAPAGTVGRSGKVKTPARVAQGAGRATVAANRTAKPKTMSTTSVENRLSRVGQAGKRRERRFRAAGADLRLDGIKLEKARNTDKRARAYKRKLQASSKPRR